MSFAEKFKTQLETIWNRPQEKPEDAWVYTKALGTLFVGYVDFSEKMLRALYEKTKKLEADLATVTGMPVPVPVTESTGASAGNGHVGGSSDMVRLDSQGDPMNAEDQAAEERADLSIDGKIDRSRYVPRGTVRAQSVPQSAPAATPPTAVAQVESPSAPQKS